MFSFCCLMFKMKINTENVSIRCCKIQFLTQSMHISHFVTLLTVNTMDNDTLLARLKPSSCVCVCFYPPNSFLIPFLFVKLHTYTHSHRVEFFFYISTTKTPLFRHSSSVWECKPITLCIYRIRIYLHSQY